MSSVEGRDALALAEEAYALVQVSPGQARRLAERALEAARGEGSTRAEVTAMHALAWAQFQVGDPSASRTVRLGIRIATRCRDQVGEALLRRRLAFSYAHDGRLRRARSEMERAVSLLDGVERARSEVFRLAIQLQSYEVDPEQDREVLEAATTALRVLSRRGEILWQARLLFNRGVLFLRRDELMPARRDFARAQTLYRAAGASVAAGDAAANLAVIALRRGDLPGCLRTIEAVTGAQAEGDLGLNVAGCRVEALTQARLLPEAQRAAEDLIDICTRSGRPDGAAQAVISLAEIRLLAGEASEAGALAAQAARSFAARGRGVSAALARCVALRAQLDAGDVQRSAARSAVTAARALEEGGWHRDALRARLLAARLSLAAGAPVSARRELERASRLQVIGTVADRAELALGRALLYLTQGDRRRAARTIDRALAALEEYRAALGTLDLRASASQLGDELARTGLRLVLSSARPDAVLFSAERLRANSLRVPPVLPARDRQVQALQAELRGCSHDADALNAAHAASAARRRVELEERIRDRMRLARGRAAAVPPIRLDSAVRLLGGRVLVEYIRVDGQLHALSLARGRARLDTLGASDAAADVDWLRFSIASLTRRGASSPQRRAAVASAREAARALDRILLAPLRPLIDRSDGVVVVPTGDLFVVPWHVLPSVSGRPLTVAPSAAIWARLARSRPARARGVVLAAGPRLRAAGREVRELSDLYPGATVLAGRAATARAVLDSLEGASLAHLACHGIFRSDSPLFSSLELADGPLNVYDLQRLRRPPAVVVLSACDVAVSRVQPGDELLGPAAALLGIGTRSVVASVAPVPDAGARRLMVSLHRRLLAGEGVAEALAHAQADRPEFGFVCLGAG